MKPKEMFAHWHQVRRDLLETFEKFSQEDLDFKPFEGSWPVGQIFLHIADCEDNWLHGVVRGEFEPWIGYSLEEHPTKEAILGVMQAAWERTTAFLESLETSDLEKEYKVPGDHPYTLYWIIWHVLEHEIHHRGELSLILGMLGKEGLDV